MNLQEMNKLYSNFKHTLISGGIFLAIGVLWPMLSNAQSLPIGSPQEALYRNMQLLEQAPITSFSLRPVIATGTGSSPNDSLLNNLTAGLHALNFAGNKGLVKLLPVTWKQQFTAHHPYGWNDGSMIPAKGYQTSLSAGLFAKIGILSVQLQPEVVYASNASFDGYAKGKTDVELQNYYQFYNYIDAPEQFGQKAYTKAFWGQSSIRLNYGPASLGFSTENLWWGPGIQNALLMTNNAPGFKHFTLNTTRPINTGIGAFEGQIIGGWLKESGFSPLKETSTSMGINLYGNPSSEQRYLSGLNINYQPKWIPGLTLGFIRTFMAYNSEIRSFGDYIPFFVRLQKQPDDQDRYPRDQRISLYARMLLQKAKAEVYFEYGLNDNAYNFRDFAGSPDHGRAYLFGFNKLVPLNAGNNQYIQVNAEITQLSQSIDRTVRGAGGFYQHVGVDQGYTHMGQVLGAGTGTGGNIQSIQLNWLKGYKKLGLGVERLEHNMDFYETAIGSLNGYSRNWVDFSLAATGQWDFKHFIFNAKLQGIRSLNYQWLLKDYVAGNNYVPNNDLFNFQATLGINYRF